MGPSNLTTVIWTDKNWWIKHFDKKSFFTIDHNGIISYCRHNHNGNRHLCTCNCSFCSHFDEFGHCNFINWNSFGSQSIGLLAFKFGQVRLFILWTISSLHILHVDRRNEGCCMDRCYSIKLDDCRKGSFWMTNSLWLNFARFIRYFTDEADPKLKVCSQWQSILANKSKEDLILFGKK